MKLLCVVLAVVAVAEGVVIFRMTRADRPPGEATSQALAPQAPATEPTVAASHMDASPAARAEVEPAVPVPPGQQASVLADLQKRKLARVSVRLLGGGKVSDAFAQLFELSEVERRMLDDQLTAARRSYDALLASHAQVTRTGENTTEVSVTSFVDEGRALYERIDGAFAATLGTERYAAFLGLSASELEDRFNQFGAEERKLTITTTPQPDGTRKVSVHDAQNSGTESGWSTRDFDSPDAFARAHPEIAELLHRIGPSP